MRSISKLFLTLWVLPALGNFIDSPSLPVGGGGGGTGTPAAAPAASPAASVTPPVAAVTPNVPTASPSAVATVPPTVPPVAATTVPPNADPNADNIRVLRESHETLRSLGDLNTVRDGLGIYTKVWSEAQTLGRQLDYTEASLQASFKADPVATLNVLRQEAAQQRQSPQYQEDQRVRALVDKAVQPITEQFARQQADRHNAAIDSEFTRLFNSNEAFKPRNGIEAPVEVRGIIHDRFIETIKWNQPLIQEIIQGKMSGLQKVFDEIVTDTLGGWNKYNSWGQPAAGTGTGTGTGQPAVQVRGPNGQFIPPVAAKPAPTLDQIIEGASEADVLPSMRGFR